MSKKTGITGEIIKSYLTQHPDMATRTLARLAYKENPELWSSVDAARKLISMYKGKNGKAALENLTDRRFVIPKATEDNKFAMPEPDTVAWEPYDIPKTCHKILNMADIHIPYHDRDAIDIAIQYGIDAKCDTVILGGDIMDCYKVSNFGKDPRCRSLSSEIEATRHFLMALRQNAFPDAKIIYKEGNHEERIPRYGTQLAPELFEADMIKSLDEILELDRIGIKWLPGKRPMYLNQLNIMHGHEYGGRSGGVNPSRNMYLKTKECCICAHWHRTSQYNGKTIRDRVIGSWTVGCLCDQHPEYMPVNDWNLGFAVIERDDDDWFIIDNKRIINNRVV